METKYCTVKLFILPWPPVPCSYQHQPLRKKKAKKIYSLDLCACKLTHIYVPCFEILSPFLCSRIHSCRTVSEQSQRWVFLKLWIVHSGKAVEHIINKTNVVVHSAPRCPTDLHMVWVSVRVHLCHFPNETHTSTHKYSAWVSESSVYNRSCSQTTDVASPRALILQLMKLSQQMFNSV